VGLEVPFYLGRYGVVQNVNDWEQNGYCFSIGQYVCRNEGARREDGGGP
jgi:hypothetical protein